MKLLLDQGVSRSAVSRLSEKGIDTNHVADIGFSEAEDSEIIVRAREEGRVIVTIDADFHALIALTAETSPSVIRLRMQGLTGQAVADILLAVIAQCENYLETGALITVQEEKVRIRSLPIIPKQGQ